MPQRVELRFARLESSQSAALSAKAAKSQLLSIALRLLPLAPRFVRSVWPNVRRLALCRSALTSRLDPQQIIATWSSPLQSYGQRDRQAPRTGSDIPLLGHIAKQTRFSTPSSLAVFFPRANACLSVERGHCDAATRLLSETLTRSLDFMITTSSYYETANQSKSLPTWSI